MRPSNVNASDQSTIRMQVFRHRNHVDSRSRTENGGDLKNVKG
jgi:hypothetical protein